MTHYRIYYVPTEKGRRAFGWQEKRMPGIFETREDAGFARAEWAAEEPAPDSWEYANYDIRPVPDPELPVRLKRYNRAYRSGEPLISDEEYDRMLGWLREEQPDHPFLVQVEAEAVPLGKRRIRHPRPMLSTDKAKSPEEMGQFIGRMARAAVEIGLAPAAVVYRVTPKLDGLAGRDEEGVLSTRGTGQEGYDITRVFERGVVPVGGRGRGLGELVIAQSYFEELLADEFEHPRNVMVGLVNADTLTPAAERTLAAGAARFVPYAELPRWEGSGEALRERIDELDRELREAVDYKTDGLVAEVTNPELRQHLGATSHHHRWQVAYKRPSERARTRIKGIAWQTGRTGVVTPVLEVEPVWLSGATISRLTAHHAGMVLSQRLGPGAVVEISRSGEVIPKLEAVLAPAERVHIPGECPCCSEPLTESGDFLRCTNETGCSAQTANQLIHFFSTLGNADLFGPKTIDRLVAGGFDSLPRIYGLRLPDLRALQFGPGQSANLVKELERSRTQPVEDWRFLAAIGIPHLGRGDSRKLLQEIPLEALGELTPGRLMAIHGFGPVTSPVITDALGQRWPEVKYLLHEVGFQLIPTMKPSQARIDGPMAGKGVVFTGAMQHGTREQMQEQARALGALVQSSVSRKTNFLVCGERVGASKMNKARDLGVQVLNEAEYLELIAQHEGSPTRHDEAVTPAGSEAAMSWTDERDTPTAYDWSLDL